MPTLELIRPSTRARRRNVVRWLITLAATAVSAYALDAVATAAGLLLVATGVAGHLGVGAATALLAASYLTWIAGLRVNLRANWDLLRSTGTSTNALSKVAYDLARRQGASVRIRRIAAGAGYVGTEIAKELPYYAGAFGTTFLVDSVTARDAVVFLAGANFGAAAYEYALGRLTRAFLGRRRASFDADWVPEAYLHDYYREVESDERATIAFFVDAVRRADPGRPMLFFGVGPTLHHVFLAAGTASELHLADYLPANLAAIQRWLDRDPDAHDWRPFVRYTLECEGVSDPSERQVTDREELARAKITRLIQVDGRVPDPDAETYSTVISAYCADSATSDLESWRVFMRNVMARVRPGGLFITAALRRSRGYAVGGKVFPSAGVDEHDVRRLLDADVAGRVVEVRNVPDAASHGYEGIVLARAQVHEPALARRSA